MAERPTACSIVENSIASDSAWIEKVHAAHEASAVPGQSWELRWPTPGPDASQRCAPPVCGRFRCNVRSIPQPALKVRLVQTWRWTRTARLVADSSPWAGFESVHRTGSEYQGCIPRPSWNRAHKY